MRSPSLLLSALSLLFSSSILPVLAADYYLRVGVDLTLSAALAKLPTLKGASVELQLKPVEYKERIVIDYNGIVSIVGVAGIGGSDDRATIRYDASKDAKNSKKTEEDNSALVVKGGAQVQLKNLVVYNETPGKGPTPALYVSGNSSLSATELNLNSLTSVVYIGSGARGHIDNSFVLGASDVFYGGGTFIYDKSSVLLIGAGNVVAWKGGSGFKGSKPGCYILSTDVSNRQGVKGPFFLGRPLDDKAVIVFTRDSFSLPLDPSIWAPFSPTDPRVSPSTKLIEIDNDGVDPKSAKRKYGKVLPPSESGNYVFESLWGKA